MRILITLLLMLGATANAEERLRWTEEQIVRNGIESVMRVSATLSDGFLIVRLVHEKGWHSFAMDNELRSMVALQGQPSLGTEQGLRIQTRGDLRFSGGWSQTRPVDFSKPALRWYSYGFDRVAHLARRLDPTDPGTNGTLILEGQACSGETCCRIDVKFSVSHERLVTAGEDADAPDDQLTAREIVQRLIPVANKPADLNEKSTRLQKGDDDEAK